MSRISLYPTSWNGHPSSMDGLFYGIFNLSSYIAQQFFQFLEDLLFGSFHGLSDYLGVDSPEEYPMPVRRSSSESVIQCFSSSNSLEGFKPQGNCGRSSFDKKELRVKPRRFVIIEHNSCFTQLISRVLLLQKCSLRCICQIASAPWRCIVIYARFATARAASLLCRIRKTFRGSSGDIGWLQRAPGMAPVVDGTPRFLELLQGIRDGKHTLPDLFVYLLVPGLFSNHSPLYFVSTKRSFSKMGLACHIAKIHSEASVEHNAWELKQYVEELYWGSGKPVMLLGHSKGGVDAAAALSLYWSSLKDKVAGLALVQSPYGGTPVASDILRQGQIADKETRKVAEFLICKMIKGDIRSLEDLTYDKRREFVLKHKLPDQIPIIAFHSEASIAPGVLATMSQIAHAELPWLPLPRFCGASEPSDDCVRVGRKVPVVIPLAAVMAIYAVHLRLRYGEKSDGMVACRDAEVPGSVVIRPDRKLDHAWMVYSSWKKNSGEPDCVDMCEAILSLLVEMGNEKLAAGTRG